uniref:C3H1-type domain-containing protein n=1 Tax=Meloidogyne javanica TaxID=6303 RepID=A0A915M296_MELJA
NSPKDANYEKEIIEIFDQLQQFIERDFPINRRVDGLNVANNAKIIYLHMAYLNNRLRPTEQLAQKVSDVLTALQQITKLSHDQYYGPVRALENRKLQISLGLVEVLTELFVLDINIFGIQLTSYEKCSKFRRSIGNALMNLVYQQREAKSRLCSNRQFLLKVADFYAGLIQNVSYNSDPTISQHLSVIVPPLVRTAVNISLKERDGVKVFDPLAISSQHKQQLLKVLSALWNLAEDPAKNKHVMCIEVPEFVPMLLRIMFCDHNELQLIQAATGIIKHLSGYFLQFHDLFAKILRKGLTSALMRQLTSSSSDLIIDSLSALYTLSRHPIIGKEILSNEAYMQQIAYLTRNTNEGISRASRLVLNNVYSVTVYFAKNAVPLAWPIQNLILSPVDPSGQLASTNYSSGLNQNDPLNLNNQDYPEKKDVSNLESRLESSNDCVFVEGSLLDHGGQDLPTSVMCTRNASSRSSINSTDVKLQILKALDENKHSGHCTNADISGNSDVHAGDVIKNANILSEDQSSEGILAEAIRDFMPKPKDKNVSLNADVTRSSTPILTPISCNSPCKATSENDGPKHKRCTQLLEDSIAAVMPSPKHSILNQFRSRDASCSGTSSSNARIQHNNSEEEDLLLRSSKKSLNFDSDVASAQLIVVDCQKISSKTCNQSEKMGKNIQYSGRKSINKPEFSIASYSCLPLSIEADRHGSTTRRQRFWQQKGVCNNGDQCKWAHGDQELRRSENGLGMVRSGLVSDEQTSSVMIGPQLEGPLPKREIIEDDCVNDLLNDRKRNWQEAGLEIADR